MRIHKIISMVSPFLVSLIVAAALFYWCGIAQAAQDGDFTYTVTNGQAQVTGYTGAGGNIIIPDTLGGYQVTSIGTAAFRSRTDIISINLPEGITDIRSSAFENCKNLASINIPDSVTSIGVFAFSGCIMLISIDIPQGVTSIGDRVFGGCSRLTSINVDSGNLNYTSIDGVLYNKACTLLIKCPGGTTSISIPQGVASIGDYAFAGCSITTVQIPGGVASIGDYAFAECYGLNDISIPQGVTSIGEWAFLWCTDLDNVNLPTGITSIAWGTFYNCQSLTNVSIPEGVTSIGPEAFKYCYFLGNITLPQTLTTIGFDAFDSCWRNLTSISIPPRVTSIGNYAFYGCVSLTSITFPDGLTNIDHDAFRNCTGLRSITLPNGLTTIAYSTFYGCTGLISVTFPDGLTSIGNNAFEGCTSLSAVTLPQGITNIASSTFKGCTGLTSVILPDGLTSIDSSAFYDCVGLASISVPQGVSNISVVAFSGCSSLTNITVSVNNTNYASIDGVLYDKAETTLIICPPGLTSVSIPEGVSSIGINAFYRCNWITNITLPETVTSIGGRAFFWSGITSITFNSATTQIYDSFDTIPDQATIIGYDPSTAKEYAAKYGRTFELIYTGGDTNGIHLTKSSLTENDIEINGQGVGYAYFKLIDVEDGNITPLANRTITYSYSGYGDSYITTSDDDGEIVFATPTLYDSQSLTLTIQSISGTSEPVESPAIDVQVTELSFEEEWEGTVGIGLGAEVGIGAGGAIGIAEAEAEIAGVGLKANCKPSMILKNSYDNGIRSLEITNKLSSEAAASAKVGLFGKIDVSGADIDINPVGIKGEATYGANAGIGLKIDDYDPNNIDDASKVGVYLLNDALTAPGAMSGTNVVTAKLLDLININVYDTTISGSKVKLEGGAEIGSLEVEGCEPVTLVGGTATTTFSYETVQEADGDYQYETGYKTEGKISFADLGYIPPILSIGALSNDVSLTANDDSNEQSLELETARENNSIEILWYEESIGEKTKLQFSGVDYSALYNGNSTIKQFCDGSKGYFSRQDWVDTLTSMHESKVSGDYSVSTEKVKGIDVELPFKLKLLLGAEIILYSSGLDTVSYDTQHGVLSDGRALKHSESLGIDNLVDANRLPLTTILAEPMVALGNMVGDFVSKVGDTIVKGVQNGAAAVVGVVNDVSGRIVNIYKIITPISMQKSYVIMALPSEYSLLSETYVAVTVGEPYVVMVTDADGTEIPEFEPLSLEISYDDAMLATAGIAADSTLIDRMKIYYWDEEKATYLNRGGLVDKVNKKVTLDISKGGQYILAIDNLGPDIGNFTVSNHSATPLLSAYVTDLSGLDESTFRFSIDDNTLVNGDNLTDYFNYSTGKFSYQVQEPLAEGEHTASIIVDDTSGNALPQAAILQFIVDTQPPTIVEVNIPEDIIAGDDLAITVTTSEADRAFVSIAYPLGEGWSDFETLSMTSPSENTWNAIIRNTSISNRLKVKIWIYDAAGNVSASPEVIVNIAPPVSGSTLSGQVLVEGDDLTEGQTHYSGGVNIELKQGEEIKYSATTSEAEDLASNGSFSLTGIAAGDYTVVISKAGYLTRSFALTINSNLTLSTTSEQYLNRIYLWAGDTVSDEYNVIAASDVNYILSKFNSNSTQAGFDPQADIVKDQYDVISAADVNLMLSNFNKNSTQYPADIIY